MIFQPKRKQCQVNSGQFDLATTTSWLMSVTLSQPMASCSTYALPVLMPFPSWCIYAVPFYLKENNQRQNLWYSHLKYPTRQKIIQFMKLYILGQRLLHTWTDSLDTFFETFAIMKISKNDSNIIWRSSKDITFPKIWRLWLKNWVRHAHFNFELLKGVAVLFSELCPSNFGQW